VSQPTSRAEASDFATLLSSIRRKKRDVTQNKIASHIGVSPSTISLWENGKRIPRDKEKIRALADILGISEETKALLFQAAGYASSKPSFRVQLLEWFDRFLASPNVELEKKIKVMNMLEILKSMLEAGMYQQE
jgi:transcriptional regulator with XRE-family HTH domain